VRSGACPLVFSSTDNPRAASGGWRYSPRMSRTLSMNCGSVDSLKVSTRWGLRPKARQIRLTAVWLIPSARASDRVDQCVASFGVVANVVTNTCSICSSVSLRGAPGAAHRPGLPAAGPQTASATWSPWAATLQAAGHRDVAGAFGAGQHDPAALGQRLAALGAASRALQRRALLIGQRQGRQLGTARRPVVRWSGSIAGTYQPSNKLVSCA
jgi:hypothetical protein